MASKILRIYTILVYLRTILKRSFCATNANIVALVLNTSSETTFDVHGRPSSLHEIG
jgi:hypothetical protein